MPQDTKGITMRDTEETILETARFKDEASAIEWSKDKRIKNVRDAISISKPYRENASEGIWYAPVAIDVLLPAPKLRRL